MSLPNDELREQITASIRAAQIAGMIQADSIAFYVESGLSGWLTDHDRRTKSEAYKRGYQDRSAEHDFDLGGVFDE